MKILLPVLAATLLVAAGCDREPERGSAAPPTQTYNSSTSSGASGGSTTTTTPADVGQPASSAERKEGANPVQGQVDPKQGEQRQDFQQRGDSKGPTSPETQPR